MRGHLPAFDDSRMDPAPALYLIRINGHLGATMLSAFPAMAPQHHGAHTVLTGLLDQSALYGVLAEIEALGLDLIEIRKLTTPDRESPGPGDSRLPGWRVLRAPPVPVARRCRCRGRCRGAGPARPGALAPAQGRGSRGGTIKAFGAPGQVG